MISRWEGGGASLVPSILFRMGTQQTYLFMLFPQVWVPQIVNSAVWSRGQ